ncbi:NAD(P)/FAD-dependent oxidoreductase [Psychrosphaera aestuarii]|uniref:NAD(P)/FAD-dependent oxidoreductase n=1 Tax=Psychrosphaera aestuarii TaxID=1266052 RepID=UPI001B340937|nr:NAD(P)-binding protein [Psychrosphaera aestuarii]
MKIAIIGAGLTGAVVADKLSRLGHNVTVIEKSRGRGGRMNTKRLSWANCDMGAQYFTARDPQFINEIEQWQTDGLVEPWAFSPSLLRAKVLAASPDAELRYVATPEMNSIAKHLLKDKKLELNTKINHITNDDGKWLLWRDNMELVGIYDWLISTIPAEQAFELFADIPSIQNQIPHDVHEPCWAVTLATQGEVSDVLQGVFSREKVSWLARQNHKPQRQIEKRLTSEDKSGAKPQQKIDDLWNIHFDAAFTKQHIGVDSKNIQNIALDWLNELIINNNLGDGVRLVDGYAHFWRYARPAESYIAEYEKNKPTIIFDAEQQYAIIGDWAKGGRVEGAYLSAVECVDAFKSNSWT